MPKLQTRVPARLGAVIARVQIDKDLKKGRAMSLLVDLAIKNPEFAVEDFGDGDTVNCTLEMPQATYDATKDYRALHSLTSRSAFFKDALARGASYYSK